MRPMTYERWVQKNLRRSFSRVGWILLIYYAMINVAVLAVSILEIAIGMIREFAAGNYKAAYDAGGATGNWGYLLAIGVGLLILLLWKKPRFWKEEIWAKGKPMGFGTFWGLLCVFLSCQMIYQFAVMAVELILNAAGLTMLEGLEAMAADTDQFSMFLYAGILAPISEELLFRGLIQRTLLPYGRKFAIFCSAFAFGLFHGNLYQSPYAFLVGLILGYVASEYSIAWAMVLHMVNNLVIADMIPRVTAGLPEEAASLIIWAVIFVCTVAAIVVLIVKRREVGAWMRQERMNGLYLKCFFTCPGMILLMILMVISMVVTTCMTITPL